MVYTDCHYDEEKALYLLKLHNYNISDAIHTLTLQKPDKSNKNFSWLYSKKQCQPQQEEDEESDVVTSDGNDNHLYQYNGQMSIMGNMSQSMEQSDIDNNNNNNNNNNCIGDIKNNNDFDDEDYCFACGDGGNLLICDIKDCNKVWHIHCAGLTKMPEEDRWYCPSHSCCICKYNGLLNKKSMKQYMCSYCGNAYCSNHVPIECKKYEYKDIEFLCDLCLSTQINDNVKQFASERFISRLMELHKKRKKIYIKKNYNNDDYDDNNILKDINKKYNIIPSHCKLGRTEIDWFDLYQSVISMGGLSKMGNNLNKWDIIRKKCGLNKNFVSQNIWESLRGDYIEYLYAYEKQYYPLTQHNLPSNIQNIVDSKGALDGLFPSTQSDDEDADDEGEEDEEEETEVEEIEVDTDDEDDDLNHNKTPENIDNVMLID